MRIRWCCVAVALLMPSEPNTLLAANATQTLEILKISNDLYAQVKLKSATQENEKLILGVSGLVNKITELVHFPDGEMEKVACNCYDFDDEKSEKPTFDEDDSDNEYAKATNATDKNELNQKFEEARQKTDNVYRPKGNRSLGNMSRHAPSTDEMSYNHLNNYMRKESKMAQEGIKPDKISDELMQNVEHLSNFVKSDFSTLLCVALRNNKKDVKKFVFMSGKDPLTRCRQDEAYTLGYDYIHTDQGHAEVGFLSSLLEKPKEYYTHIVGMACHREICTECDVLLQLALGENYRKVVS